jgi:hypothetical protein
MAARASEHGSATTRPRDERQRRYRLVAWILVGALVAIGAGGWHSFVARDLHRTSYWTGAASYSTSGPEAPVAFWLGAFGILGYVLWVAWRGHVRKETERPAPRVRLLQCLGTGTIALAVPLAIALYFANAAVGHDVRIDSRRGVLTIHDHFFLVRADERRSIRLAEVEGVDYVREPRSEGSPRYSVSVRMSTRMVEVAHGEPEGQMHLADDLAERAGVPLECVTFTRSDDVIVERCRHAD